MNEAELELLKTAVAVSFSVDINEIGPLVDPQEVSVRLVGTFEDGETEAAWAAMPFLYAVACLSFADARPRGNSAGDFGPKDELELSDFLPHLRLSPRGLEWYGDYIKGRRVKTDLRVSPSGRFEVQTWERGEAATRWLDRLQGRRPLQAVESMRSSSSP